MSQGGRLAQQYTRIAGVTTPLLEGDEDHHPRVRPSQGGLNGGKNLLLLLGATEIDSSCQHNLPPLNRRRGCHLTSLHTQGNQGCRGVVADLIGHSHDGLSEAVQGVRAHSAGYLHAGQPAEILRPLHRPLWTTEDVDKP